VIALATADLTEQAFDDIDRPALVEAFSGRAEAEFVHWDDETVDWSGYELVVLRSTWDYPSRPAEFDRWLGRVAAETRLLNPRPTVTWNLNKTYLAALQAGGVPVVRTGYVDDLAGFDRELDAIGARQIVVKPTVSAGSDHTGRFDRYDGSARDLAERILAQGKRVMLQPYYESVTRQGEIAVVHFDGAFSHAFRKGPILDVGGGFLGGGYAEVVEAVEATATVLTAAEQALDRYQELVGLDPALAGAEPLLYSRVDLIDDDEGRARCLELELIEPSFFFSTSEKAAGRFVDAVLARL
jgi:glutathione synthase/RimK-type ligase-like ATP-grasp enzyme